MNPTEPSRDVYELAPDPAILIESLRDIGYDFNSAVADIIDNSIAAHATSVHVFMTRSHGLQVAIFDNGNGLARRSLLNAMRLGSTNPRDARELGDLGRFGLGLKTASFSQCRRLTVASRVGGETSAFTWDLDRVAAENTWGVLDCSGANLPYLDEIGDSGTLVLWEELDRLADAQTSERVWNGVVKQLQDHLSLVFHRYLAGESGIKRVTIRVNGLVLEPMDPFNSSHPATQIASEERVGPGVTLRGYTLPHRSRYESEAAYERYGLPGGYFKNQGIYLYRAKRLIMHGSWFRITKRTPATQLCRVQMDIDTDQDEAWKIDVKKVSAQMPERVRAHVRNIVDTLTKPSKQAFQRRAAVGAPKEAYPVWNAEQVADKRMYSINRKHPVIDAALESLDQDQLAAVGAVLQLIESELPVEAISRDLVVDAEGIAPKPMAEGAFADTCRSFFAGLRAMGVEDEEALATLKNIGTYSARWPEVLRALDYEVTNG